MSNKPNALIVTPFFSPNIGGVETHLDDLVDELNRHHIPSVVSTYSPLTTKIIWRRHEKRGMCDIYRLGWFGHNWFPKIEKNPVLTLLYLFPGLFFQTVRLLLRNPDISVIHAQGITAALITRCVNIVFHKRIIMSTHAIYSLPQNPILARVFTAILRGFDRILTLSELSKIELISAGVPAQKVDRYMYWVNQDIFKPGNRQEIRKKLGWTGKTVFLFVGRLLVMKGTRIVSELAGRMTGTQAQFVVVGTGPDEQYVAQSARRYPNLKYLGALGNRKLPEYYRGADYLLVPSQYPEGMARVVMEAMSSGLPVVATKSGCMPEMMTHEKTGMLTGQSDKEILPVLCGLLRQSTVQKKYARAAVHHARKFFTNTNVLPIINAYRNISI